MTATSHRASPDDEAFRHAFEAFKLSASDFDHRAHVRLAYVYLCEQSVDQAHASMKRALLAFLEHLEVPASKYHETLTRAWIMAVRHFMAKSPGCSSADEFIDHNAVLLNTKIMLEHYSAEVLFSEQARQRFVEPDAEHIPKYDKGS
jgi:hypothetical protein